ncbi:amino acid permease-domain-containing protein [Crassisporium funariophilum]|nr:amino acid permease-domain-containing protein [Crassisporium funariophilum]
MEEHLELDSLTSRRVVSSGIADQRHPQQDVVQVHDNPRRRWSNKRPLIAAKDRLAYYQEKWGQIGEELPPQINRSFATFRSSRDAHPSKAYIVTGSVVWSVVISIGEIVAFIPNVGGPVGLAGVYVDPALGFALGWNAWYNWTIILPTELSAAAILFNGFFKSPDTGVSDIATISVLLVLAIGINCFGARAYGEAEFIFSCFKILTIIGLIIAGIILDLGGGKEGFIGFKHWREPGPLVAYRAKGALGRFLGVWTSMNQAVFAFFGTEVPGVAAGAESRKGALKTLKSTASLANGVDRTFLAPSIGFGYGCKSTIFYVLSVFVAGLLVSSADPRLKASTLGNKGRNLVFSSPFVIAMSNSHAKHLDKICNAAFVISAFSAAVSDVYISSRFLYYLARFDHAPRFCAKVFKSKHTVVPWVGILVSAAFALLAFMSVSDAQAVFHWLSSMSSTTALLSWIGMLFTYIRWYQGTVAAEKKDPEFRRKHADDLYKNRKSWQPWIAIYAFCMCILILLFNGWFVFTRPGPWRMASEVEDPSPELDPDFGDWVPTFISSYLAIPVFALFFLGYKLVYRTKFKSVNEMQFRRGIMPEIPEEIPHTRWGKLLAALF